MNVGFHICCYLLAVVVVPAYQWLIAPLKSF
uniref:Uncharacterized protein n=1 Tax=Arundo donax TaxID=35708 RepID=A0A0A9AEU4_ARUDO